MPGDGPVATLTITFLLRHYVSGTPEGSAAMQNTQDISALTQKTGNTDIGIAVLTLLVVLGPSGILACGR